MTHEDAFLQDILESHDDDVPRRVFADWLLDHADPVRAARGEFVHTQLDLAKRPTDPERLAARERELLEAHGREWGAPLARLGCQCWQYRRGFVEGVGLPGPALLAHSATLFRVAPIRELKLLQAAAALRQLVELPALARLHVLDLESNELRDDHLETLASSGNLAEVTTLLLWCNRIGEEGVAALVRADLPRLTRLDLAGNVISDAGAAALAASELLGRLRLLDLTNNQIGDAGALALAASPMVEGLGWLDLSKNPIGPGGQAALRERLPGRVQVWG